MTWSVMFKKKKEIKKKKKEIPHYFYLNKNICLIVTF